MTLELIPLDKHWAREIAAEGNASLAAACSNFDAVSSDLEDAVDAHIALYERTGASAPWIAYLGRIAGSRKLVGICSFKDTLRNGRAEIACFTFPRYQRRGFGSMMAAQLVELAFKHPELKDVIAHTEPRESACTRILSRLSFRNLGCVTDPVNGEVWRWVLSRSDVAWPKRQRFEPMMAVFSFVMRGT